MISSFNQLSNIILEYYSNSDNTIEGQPTTRQQRGYTGAGRVHQNLLPARDRIDSSLNAKVEILRNKDSGKELISSADLQYIIPKYDLQNLTKTSPKFLGKSGIKIYWDETVNSFVLEK
jgi:hypothetical protein